MKLFRLLLFAAMATKLLAGCKKVVNNDPPLPAAPVTYEAIEGCWQLTEWNGEELAEGTYLYAKFDGVERRFEMWDNLGSMYVQHKSGSFTITTDKQGNATLSGVYDYGVGDWGNDYLAKMLGPAGEKMVWYAEEENIVFSHIDEIPELN